jgi:hypothetical protein
MTRLQLIKHNMAICGGMKAVVVSTKLSKPYKFGTCAMCTAIYYSTVCIKETMLQNKKIIYRNRNSRRLGFIAVVRFSSPLSRQLTQLYWLPPYLALGFVLSVRQVKALP